MIKNRYTRTIDTMKISDKALNKALQNVRNNDRTREIEYTAKRTWKLTSAAAVCMAAVIAVGGILWSVNRNDVTSGIFEKQLPEIKNSFIVLANSRKLTADSEVTIGEFYGTNSYQIGYITENSGEYDNMRSHKDVPIDYFQVGVTLQIPIHCEGENIESVTYSVENYVGECESINQRKECFDMYLYTDESYDGIIDSNATKEFRKGKGLGGGINAGTSFTCAYDNQPVGYEMETNLEKFKHRTSKLLLPIEFCVRNEKYPEITPSEYFSFSSNKDEFSTKEIFYDAFTEYYDSLKIDITANFTNGTSQTKTVQLLCDTVETGDNVSRSINVINIKGTLVEE